MTASSAAQQARLRRRAQRQRTDHGPRADRGQRTFRRPIDPPFLAPIQLVLAHIVASVARRHPALFNRLGPYRSRRFRIDLTDLPISLVLHPERERPTLRAVLRRQEVACEARIAGSFLTLLALIDGRLDSDAIFFSRELKVSGDTEAVVALRNALDDLDDPLAEIIANGFGPLSGPARLGLAALRRMGRSPQ